MRKIINAILATAVALCLLSGCKEQKKEPTEVDKLTQKAEQAAREAAEQTLTAHEIEMIAFRRGVMGRVGLQLYVVFLNDMGQPVDYFVTDRKCTSSRKRLTSETELAYGDRGSYFGYFAVPAASEDGTHGQSDDYIYCKTVDGKYKQWNGDYYASDAPIELTIKPLVIDIIAEGESGIQSQQ